MQFPTVFREKALARRAEREAIDARLQVTAPHEWLLVLGLGVVLVALLAYALVGRVERSLAVETALVLPGMRADVLASVSGVVVDVLSDVGDPVAEGQPIAQVQTLEAGPGETAGAHAPAVPRSGAARRGADNFRTQDIVSPHAGELATLTLVAGQRVAAGELAARIRMASVGPVEAIGFVTREEALRIAPGMPARVRLVVSDAGEARVLPARVEHVSPRVVVAAPWLTEFGLEPPPRAHQVRATLTDPEAPPVIDGSAGTLRIVLGYHSFASLLFAKGGD